MDSLQKIIIGTFKDLFNGLLDLVYPPLCLICEKRLGEDEDQLCTPCLTNFILLGKPHAKFSVPGEIFLGTAWALFEFDEAFQNLIHHLKYSHRRRPVRVVLDHYQREIIEQLPKKFYDLVISVPLHPRKLRERGYNQVDDMSAWLADKLQVEIGNHLVQRIKYTQTQTKLDAEQRQRNVAAAFAVKDLEEIAGKQILLVDDVLTTGATSNALAGVLSAAGALQIDLMTLSTPPHESA